MTSPPTTSALPPAPPAELLAELDTAARSLEELAGQGGELSLLLDERAGTVTIRLDDDAGSRQLTPAQLFRLLSGDAM